MKKITLFVFGALLFIACDSSTENEGLKIAFDKADKTELAPGTEPVKGPMSKKTSIEYIETVHDFGNVFYPSTNSYTFKFKNTGDEPLTIFNAKASCGCTVPNKPEKPILPGEIGEMDVVFKPKEGQQGTPVTKRITVTANTDPSTTYLDIKANVLKGM